MKVPLSVHAVEQRGKEKLDIWFNGRNYTVDAPIKPYFYSLRGNLPIKNAKKEKVTAIALSDFKQKTFYKYSEEGELIPQNVAIVTTEVKLGGDGDFE